MELKSEKLAEDRGTLVLIANANLDASNVKLFKDLIGPTLAGSATVLVDMGQLEFIDSSGLGALLSCLRTMNNKNGQLKLYGMTKPVRALFELVRMHRIFSIYNTREEALASI